MLHERIEEINKFKKKITLVLDASGQHILLFFIIEELVALPPRKSGEILIINTFFKVKN